VPSATRVDPATPDHRRDTSLRSLRGHVRKTPVPVTPPVGAEASGRLEAPRGGLSHVLANNPRLASPAQREALAHKSVARKDTVRSRVKYGSREGHREGRARQGRRRRQEALPRPGPQLKARRQDHRRRVVPRDRRRHHRRALRHLRERPASSQECFGSRGAATNRRPRAKNARAERRSRTRAGARDAPQVLGCGGGGGGGGGTADEGYRLRF